MSHTYRITGPAQFAGELVEVELDRRVTSNSLAFDLGYVRDRRTPRHRVNRTPLPDAHAALTLVDPPTLPACPGSGNRAALRWGVPVCPVCEGGREVGLPIRPRAGRRPRVPQHVAWS